MLTHTRAAAAARRAPPKPPLQPSEHGGGLLEQIGDVGDEHILVVGNDGAGLMCALLRAGALEVTHLNSHARAEPDSASLAIIPHIQSLDWLASALPSIRRALLPNGCLVVCAETEVDAVTRNRIRRMLVQHGYCGIRTSLADDCLVVSAEVPAFGLHKAA